MNQRFMNIFGLIRRQCMSYRIQSELFRAGGTKKISSRTAKTGSIARKFRPYILVFEVCWGK